MRALVVVDVQNDFADPGGGLHVRGGDAVVPLVVERVRRAVADGDLVVLTQDWHPADTPHFAKDGGTWPVHCVAGTWGAELHPGLEPAAEGLRRVRKGVDGGDGYSGFSVRDPRSGEEHATELGAVLREAGVEQVEVVGLAGDYCVVETALDSVRLGWPTTMPLELTRFVELQPGDAERAVERARAAGVQVVGAQS